MQNGPYKPRLLEIGKPTFKQNVITYHFKGPFNLS